MLAFSSLCVAGRVDSWAAVAAEASRLGCRAIECALPGPAGLALPSRRIALELGVRPAVVAPLPARFAGAQALPLAGAASPDPAQREGAVHALSGLARAAWEAGIPLVVCPAVPVTSGDRLAALDALCRTLHAVTRAHPDVGIALAGAAGAAEVPDRDEVLLVLSDVSAPTLGYCHDAGAAERRAADGGPDPTTWLGPLGAHTLAVICADFDGTDDVLPPGAGRVDWRALGAEAPRAALRVLRADPRFGPTAWPAARQCLEGAGLT